MSGIDAGDLLSAVLNALGIVVAVLIAASIGPRLARRTAKRDQQERLVRLLINTWQTPANADYQSALALLPLDFKGHGAILDARADYLAHVSKPMPTDEAEIHAHIDGSRVKQATLIAAIAKDLDFDITPESLIAGAYLSQGFVERENLVINSLIAWQRIAHALERNNEMLAATLTEQSGAEERKPEEA